MFAVFAFELTSFFEYCHLQQDETLKRWQTESFPLYDEIAYLVDGTFATGNGAFRAGQPETSQVIDNKKFGDVFGDEEQHYETEEVLSIFFISFTCLTTNAG